MQGKFIVFEGTEGGGKTTQIQQVCQWLLAHPPVAGMKPPLVTREPGGTALGKQLRHILLHQLDGEPLLPQAELLLYSADRAQHVEGIIRPHLEAGGIVLCDRYTDSTVAYQGYGRGLEMTVIQEVNRIATNGLESDLTLWLDISAEMGLARKRQQGKGDRMEQATLDFHRQVRQGYVELARAHPHRIVRVDASQPSDRVTQEVLQVLQQHLHQWYGN